MEVDFSQLTKKAVTVGQAAAALQMHPRTVRDAIKRGELKAYAMPGLARRLRILVRELRRYAIASGHTIGRDTYFTTVDGLTHVLVIGQVRHAVAIAGDRRDVEVTAVPSLLAGGVVLGRRWFHAVVMDADVLGAAAVAQAAADLRQMGCQEARLIAVYTKRPAGCDHLELVAAADLKKLEV